MKFKGSFDYELEIDPNDLKDLKSFLTITDQVLDCDDESHLYVEVQADFSGYYDKGRTYGEPENCYPPEFDIEVDNIISSNNNDIGDMLPDKYINELTEYISINWQDEV